MVSKTTTQWSPNDVVIEVSSFILILASPVFALFYWICYQFFNASLSSTLRTAYFEGIFRFLGSRMPSFDIASILAYAGWTFFQAMLYKFLPGPLLLGQPTPSEHWEGLVWTVNIYSLALLFIFHSKAYYWPDSPEDNISAGHFWTDLLNGIEFHPRFGKLWDIKHFHSTRAGGVIIWNVVDISFAAAQYNSLGYLTNSMILAVILRLLVVLDFFANEKWFIGTLDIAYEHFGFYYIYGYSVFMPMIYTLQAQYLYRHPKSLSIQSVIFIALVWTIGWFLSLWANYHKDLARESQGQCTIWGAKANYIECSYTLACGKVQSSKLLCSGMYPS
ncbi:uncharacterized protein N7446_011441 [Penicillium canescens]|uniref:uncharacterized protein n=1 Tax=Penicillium canescens TaxID=5083 RepID=UPI0026E066EB|nr:uncharacterized protein N7446_011441 [Penicillium canescens]KAJ6048758.1 hypothetical protein N7446_011441 [Penicillium canescens]